MVTAIDTGDFQCNPCVVSGARVSVAAEKIPMFPHSTLSCMFCLSLAGQRIMLPICVSVPSTRSVAVDRELQSRVPRIEFVRRGCSMTVTPHSRNLGSGSAHATSLCQMPRIELMSVARICAMPISAPSLCKQFWDKRLTTTPGS